MRYNIVFALMLASGIAVAQSPAKSNPNPDASNQSYAERIYSPNDDGVKPPKTKYAVYPDYPWKETDEKRRMVVLWLIVGSDGLPHNIKVARSVKPDMDKIAVETVRKWKFAPATKWQTCRSCDQRGSVIQALLIG